MKYLYALLDTSHVTDYDWAGLVIEELMAEIRKYQKFSPERLEHDHQIGSCLIILVIAYMDHLDLPSDRGHQINYSLPRICHVSNADFEYVMEVDRNKLSLGVSFGKRPFRSFSTTPYAPILVVAPAPTAAAATDDEEVPEEAPEVPIVGSLEDWLQEQGPTMNNMDQIPVEFQHVASHLSNLFKQDVIEYASSLSTGIVQHITSLWTKRNGEMLFRMAELAHVARTDGSSAGASTSGERGRADDRQTSDGAAAEALKPTMGAVVGVLKPSSSAAAAASKPSTSAAASASQPPPSSLAAAASAPNSPAAAASHPATILAAAAPTTTLLRARTPSSNSTSYIDDVPSFDLLKLGELDMGEHETSHNSPGGPAIDTGKDMPDANKTGSSTHEKKNRKKRVAINLKTKQNQGERLSKRIKLEPEARKAYNEYIAKRLMKKPIVQRDADGNIEEQPPFVQIAGFHVSYETFYESFKRRGEIDNHVMTVWTYLFNIEEQDARSRDNTIVKKYAFSVVLTDKFEMDPTKFVSGSCTRELARLNKTWNFSKLDLFFFPIVDGQHWVLLCVNLFMEQIFWFNSITGNTDTSCFERAKHLINNFSSEALSSGVLKKNISQWTWIYPEDYPYQNTFHDCGLYTMLYMESWDGKKIDVGQFELQMINDYRIMMAGDLLLSSKNEIPTWKFVKEHCKNSLVVLFS